MSVALPQPVYDLLGEVFELMHKCAAEADRLEEENHSLRRQLQANKAASAAPASIGENLMEVLYDTLRREQIFLDDVTPEKAASFINENPEFLADLAIRLLTPVSGGGVALRSKVASVKVTSSDGGKLVTYNGQQFLDNENWLSAISR